MPVDQIQAPPSKTDLCYDSLRSGILRGTLEPGSRLVIDDLSRQMGVSQIPIREALQRLQAEGLIDVQTHIGARVAGIDADSIYEVFDLKEAMEVISGRAACQKMTAEEITHGEEILRSMDDVIDDLEHWAEGNVRFHEFICECAGMPLVGNLMLQVLGHWERIRRHYLLAPVFVYRHRVAHQEHWRLLEALRTRDPDYVEQVTRTHNRNSIAAFVEQAHLDHSSERDASSLT